MVEKKKIKYKYNSDYLKNKLLYMRGYLVVVEVLKSVTELVVK